MIIFPAIDLKDGKPVRLTKGDFATTAPVAESALKAALSFESQGATHLHMVDLDGALTGRPVHDKIIREVGERTNLFIQTGGGIRTEEDIKFYLEDVRAARVILGSTAITDPEFTKAMLEKYGARIAIGIDAKNGKASGGGWLEDSEADFIDLAREMTGAGAKTIIYTDISRDGTLSGPDLYGLDTLNKAVPADIIASGGIASIEDIKTLRALNLAAAICGKSLYQGTLNLSEALRLT